MAQHFQRMSEKALILHTVGVQVELIGLFRACIHGPWMLGASGTKYSQVGVLSQQYLIRRFLWSGPEDLDRKRARHFAYGKSLHNWPYFSPRLLV